MQRIYLILYFIFISNLIYSDERKIEDCTDISEDSERLRCFDSFFETENTMILVDQDDITIFEEKEDDSTKEKKLVIKTSRSVINENLILTGVRLSGRDYIFELNDKSSWRNIEHIRKNDLPTEGDRVELQKGLFGSMFLKIIGKKIKIRIKKIRK
tara:strand:+ start:525 stop:992 length:468 start_codon:yes stop_codon:yes gene_type:complete